MRKKLAIPGFAGILVVCVIVLLYFGFKDSYLLNLGQTDEITVEFLESEVEYFLDIGIDLDNYFGLDGIIKNFNEIYEMSEGVAILDSYGDKICSDGKITGNYRDMIKKLEGDYFYFIDKGDFFSITRLNNSDDVEGYIISTISKEKINKPAYFYIVKSLIIYFIVIVLYFLFFKNKISKDKIVLHAVIIQIFASAIKLYFYYNDIKNNILLQLGHAIEVLKDKISVISLYDIPLSHINGVDEFLKSIADRIDAFNTLNLVEKGNQITFDYTISNDYVVNLLKTSIMDTIVLSILLIFLLLEVINMYTVISSEKNSYSAESLRGFSFIYFLGYYISLVFVPLRMLELLGDKSYIFSTEIMIGLPVSLEAIIVAITAVAIIKTVEEKGFIKTFNFGCMATMVGFFLSYISINPYFFILSRMVMGFGFGICLIVMRGYIVNNPDSTKIGEGVTAFSVGVFSSLNIGCVIGGIIGDYFGLEYSFVLSGILIGIAGLTSSSFMEKNIMPKKSKTAIIHDIAGIFKERKLIFGILTFLIPFKILYGYLGYFFPVIAGKNLGWSFGEVSRGYLLNSMIIILAGINLVRFLSKKVSLEKRLFLGNFIFIAAVLIMGVMGNSLGMILSIVILSIPLAYFEGSFLEYYMGFDSIRKMGTMKSMSVYTLFDKGIAYLVPYIYAAILVGNTGKNLFIFVLSLILFIFGINFLNRLKANHSK